ncbi:glycoside hydrolase family 16 protein [Tulasnella calospora MUT 4182]|uniref:Glycoside hydrolase family 16 protein n=1 Tax=Tulasnella calospora MUT 4182 TaxID=1051891 RepID=A0A0C3Q4K1_9AGAM|nr:glycoside hydrolase family 16 protein [Tulasnella calospora MUT 4182]
MSSGSSFLLQYYYVATANLLCSFWAIMTARGELLRAVSSLIRHLLTSAPINQGPAPADPPELWLQPPSLPFYFIYGTFIAVVIIFGIFMLSIAGTADKTPPIPPVPLEKYRQPDTRTPRPARALHSRDPVAQVHRRGQN